VSARVRHPLLVAGTAALVLLVDQLSKHWALDRLADGHVVHVIGTLQFQLAFNTGAAFSQGTSFGPFIAVIAIVVVLALLWTGRSTTSRLGAVAVGMVLGGAIGNLADRAFREGSGVLGGAVVDWIDPQFWPVFNVADACVVVGGILLVLTVGLAGAPQGPGPDHRRPDEVESDTSHADRSEAPVDP
jgi:signal peptidase II